MTIELDSLKELYANGVQLKQLYYVPTGRLIWLAPPVVSKIYGKNTYRYSYVYN